MSSGKILLGVLAGIATGALLGILFAPDKGWNTRKRIAKKGEDYVDSIRDKFDEFIEDLSVKVDEVKDEVSNLAEKARTKVSEAAKEAKPAKG